MSQRDIIDHLRNMIRDMEAKRASDGDLPDFPRLPPVPRIGPGSAAAREVAPSSLETEDGEHFRVVRAVYPGGVVSELRRPPEDALPALRSLEPRLSSLDRWLYVDIETTGLTGAATVAFLVGFGEWVNGDFHIVQLFLKDRSSEEFLLEEVESRMAGRQALVTFNGKAFDVPLLNSRFTMCGLRPPAVPDAHLDLLSLVRNMGRRPEYGQSLKEAIRRFTGTVRDGDIPGHLIPALYFIYERDEDASILEPVMKHNRLDILDMACLVWVLSHVVSGEAQAGDAHALGGAGKLHLRKGNLDLARRCLETALQSLPGAAADVAYQKRLLGQVLRRQGDWKGAAEAWEQVVASGQAKDDDYLWLARCYELGSGDVAKSKEVVCTAVSRHEDRGEEPPPSLLRRLRRLNRRLPPTA